MPAYEPKREHITAAVESVLAQTFTDWQLLIRDDCSKREDTEAHIRPYLTDPRITFKHNERNLGIGGNWNACWPEGSSEYVAFLFHDDLWTPRFLEATIGALDREPRAGFAATEHTYLREGPDGNMLAVPVYEKLQAEKAQSISPGFHGHEFFIDWLKRGLRPNIIGEPSFVVLRRSLMENVGPFNESMVQYLDCEYWVRCLQRAGFVYVPENVGAFRVHPAGMSAVNQRLGRGAFERFATLWATVQHLPPSERRIGREAVVRALSQMIRQYLMKRMRRQPVSASGSGSVKKFCREHPILTLRAFMGVPWKRG